MAAGDEPTPAVEDTAKARPLAESADPAANIVKRLWRVEQELEAVEKSQTATVKMEGGGSYSYKYTGHDLILAFVRPLFAKHGVKFWPSVVKHERVGNLTILTVQVQFINVDDPTDTLLAEVVNYGADKGDKGATKAETNAVREALKKALNITSEEDKLADETTEFEAGEGATRKDLDAANEATRAAIEQWGNTFRAALKTATSKKDVQALERENSAQLADRALPAVTRDFFIELIQKRKGELS